MSRRGGQGEAIATWAVWMLLLVVVVITHSRLPVAELYRVSGDGIGAGLGRGVVLSNYPIALAAIALILIAVDVLPRIAWWAAGPALVLCAATGFTVDPKDLDFRLVNLFPALGVVTAAALTGAAARRAGASFAPRLPGDRVRLVVGVAVLALSLPWLAADLGTYFPGDVFLTRTVITEGKETLPAVHPGHHHGFDCALLFLAAVVLSRARPVGRRVRTALTASLGLMASYGAVNATEDFWHEQVVKRGWSSLRIPSAQVPSLSGVWLVILALAVVAYAVFAYERRLEARRGSGPVTTRTSPACP